MTQVIWGPIFRKIVFWTFVLRVCVLDTQSCLTLCDPMDCSLPSFSVHGILQARVLEWVAIPFVCLWIFLWNSYSWTAVAPPQNLLASRLTMNGGGGGPWPWSRSRLRFSWSLALQLVPFVLFAAGWSVSRNEWHAFIILGVSSSSVASLKIRELTLGKVFVERLQSKPYPGWCWRHLSLLGDTVALPAKFPGEIRAFVRDRRWGQWLWSVLYHHSMKVRILTGWGGFQLLSTFFTSIIPGLY